MDHFNATVLNGHLVSTRRGLQVSKSKHQGTQFINSSAASDDASSQDEPSADARPGEQQFKFLNQPKESIKTGTRRKGQGSQEGEKRRKSPKKDKEPAFVREAPKHGPPSGGSPASKFSDVPSGDYCTVPWFSSWMGNLSENEKRLVQLYLRLYPTKMYPYEQILEYNPVRSPAFLERIKSSKASLTCIIMGASYAETSLKGEWTSPDLLYYVSRVCSLVNERLSDRTVKRAFDSGILECVAAMAITGWNVGRYDHWHLHMKGLKQLIEIEGGMTGDWGYLLNLIRRADVKGAAHLGLLPYLEYPIFYQAPTDLLPLSMRNRIVEGISDILVPCGLQSYLINALTSTSLIAGLLRMAFASPNREVLLNPDAFIEEWLWCEYQLVRFPGPLRADCVGGFLTEADELTVAADLGSSEAVAAAMVRSLHTVKPIPSPSNNLLEPALRTAAIVYLETLVPDEPRNPLVHAVLLNLLSASVQKVVQRLQERQSRMGQSRDEEEQEEEGTDGLPSMEALRPVMIWVCLVGSVISKLSEMDLVTMGILFDRGYYGQCLSLVIGPEPGHVDLLGEEDLALCRFLDARGMRIRQQDERALLKGLLREHAYGVPLFDLAYV